VPNSKRQVYKKVARAVLGLIGLIVILSALLLWRLSSSPIQLNRLTPSIQKAVSNLPGGFQITLEGIELFWNRQDKDIQLRATNVVLAGRSSVPIVAAPAINISISISALMSRVIALSAIELRGVGIHLVRKKDGSLRLGKLAIKSETPAPKPHDNSDPPKEFHDLTEIIAHLFSVLESSPDPQQPLSYLKSINLEGSFTVEDRKLDMDWQSNDIDFSFRGQDNGIKGELSLSIDSPAALSGMDLEISLLARGKDITANMKVRSVQLSRLASLDKRLEVLEGVNLSLNGTVSGAMTLPDTVKSLELDVAGGTGSISLARFFPDPIQLKTLELKAKADPSAKSLDLAYLNLSLGKDDSTGPALKISGTSRSVNGNIRLDITAGLEHLLIDELAVYWPAGLALGARTWLIKNLKAGSLDKANMHMKMTLPSREGGALVLEKLSGKLAYSDLSVYFFRPLPPATGISGSGTFSQQGFDLSVENGLVEGIAIRSGRVQIKGLDVKKVVLDVKTTLAGGVADTLAVLELPPLGLDKLIGFGSADAGGEMTAEFGIALPLKSSLAPGEIDYRVDATLTHATVQNIFRNYSMENGSLKIHDDFNRLDITGSLDLAGVPITLNWNSDHVENGTLKTEIKARAVEVKAADISRLGFAVDEYFSGSFTAELDATIESGGVIDASIDTDLTNSGFSIPMLRWSKLSGIEGKASASVKIAKGGAVDVRQFRVDAGTLSASGEAGFEPENAVLKITLDSAGLGNTLLNGVSVIRNTEYGTRISVAGGHLDLEPFLVPAPSQLEGDADSAPGDLQIEVARLDRVFFDQERYLENVGIGLKYDKEGWQSIQASGRNPLAVEDQATNRSKDSASRLVPGEFNFRFGPPDNGNYPLSIEVENLGSMLSTTLDNHSLTGGYLVVQGKSSGALLKAPVDASLKLDNFTLIKAPLFAQVLSFASLNQLVRTLNSEGLSIDSFFGDLRLSGERLSTDLLRAHGGPIGLTITGNMDFGQGKIDLKGGIIPFHQISDTLGKIPLLKKILEDDDGKGVGTLDYSVTGSHDKPEITVKPGSVLTPGALRRIFDLSETEQQ
jgi:hypothetical protein